MHPHLLGHNDPGGGTPSPRTAKSNPTTGPTGAQDFEGGLGAILIQIDTNNRFAVIAYAS